MPAKLHRKVNSNEEGGDSSSKKRGKAFNASVVGHMFRDKVELLLLERVNLIFFIMTRFQAAKILSTPEKLLTHSTILM